jgi:hypothetical protein
MLLFYLFISFSFAQEATESSSEDDSSVKTEQNPEKQESIDVPIDTNMEPPEMIIFGEREVDIRRKKLENHLYHSGYREGIQKNGRTVYRPETSWKPSFIVYESGFIELKRTPPRFESYLKHRNDIWRYLACVPPFTVMCIDVNGWMINERKLRHAKEDIVTGTHSDIIAWQESLEKMSMEERIHNTIPLMLDAVWKQGLLPDGQIITTSQEKFKWILDFYSDRLCNEYGLMVREVIQIYVEEEIRGSWKENFPSELWLDIISSECQK